MRGAVLSARLLFAACDRGERTTAVDLLQVFPYTDAGQTTARIAFGTPTAEAFLRQGWSAATLAGGESVAWALARRATVQLAIAQPHDAQLVVRAGLVADLSARRRHLAGGDGR